jgi:hypothetical protein
MLWVHRRCMGFTILQPFDFRSVTYFLTACNDKPATITLMPSANRCFSVDICDTHSTDGRQSTRFNFKLPTNFRNLTKLIIAVKISTFKKWSNKFDTKIKIRLYCMPTISVVAFSLLKQKLSYLRGVR